MPAGRPTKYKPEYATDEFIEAYGSYCVDKERLVSICGLAVYLKVTEDTLYNWSKKHEAFLGSLGKIKQISKEMLINGGLSSTYNSTIAKLILSSNHGMSDKISTEHSVDENTATLLGLIDGSTKGQLPTEQEVEDAGE